MRLPLLALLLAFQFFFQAAQAQTRPVPPGIRQAEQTDAQNDKNIPPPMNPRRTIDVEKCKRDADELASLAQSIPGEVDLTTKGMLPKDLADKLKRIEKLAKQLRGQLNP